MRIASSLKTFAIAGLLSVALAVTGCQGGGDSQETLPAEPTSSSFTGGITTNPAPAPAAKGTPTGPANAEISPSEVAVGNFVMTMVVEPAQSMFDVAKQPDADSEADKDKKDDQGEGIAVLGGTMLKVTNNIDAAQNAKEDSPQGEVFRHLAVQVKDKATGQLVPYLTVSMDALRDGRPAFLDQSLVPELPSQKDVSNLRFGNNVKFPRKGTYQLFVRVEANPVLGSEVPPAAQFNLTFK